MDSYLYAWVRKTSCQAKGASWHATWGKAWHDVRALGFSVVGPSGLKISGSGTAVQRTCRVSWHESPPGSWHTLASLTRARASDVRKEQVSL